MTQNTSVGYIPASQTPKTTSILIYDGTPSAGDLTTYDEIYTTPALCFAALPAIINHAVTITVRKADGSAYAAATLQRVVAGGSITIQGEYFFKNTVASGGTGVFTLNASDVGVLAGDRVYLQRYTGVVESSSPDLALFDTVASVDGTTITLTTHTSQEITTSWVYVIVRTVTNVLSASYTNNVTFTGLNIASSTYCLISSCNEVFFTSCIFDSSGTIALQFLNSSNNSYNSNLGFSCTYTGNSAYHSFVNASRAFIRWSAIISSALSNVGGMAMIAAAYMSVVDVSRCYLQNSAGGTLAAVCARSAYVSVSITYVDGYDASSKMTVALYGIMGGVIYCTSPVFGSNITTQKSPANWAASTDGSYIS